MFSEDGRCIGIEHERGTFDARRDLLQQIEPLAADFGRPIAWAIAPIEWPKASARPICSLSSSDKCE